MCSIGPAATPHSSAHGSRCGNNRVLVEHDALQQTTQYGRKRVGEERRQDERHQCPDDDGVRFPEPELACKSDGAGASFVEEAGRGKRQGPGVEEAAAGADERNDQNDFQRIDDVIGELRSGDVEPESRGEDEAKQGGRAEQGIDADDEAGGDAPGEAFGRGSHAEEREKREDDAAVEPAVMGRCGHLWQG